MFEYLKDFSKILVTGPQRSGTTICARMIAEDTGKRFLPEEHVDVNSESSLLWLLNHETQFVLQCPALQHVMHRADVGRRSDVAVVFMERPLDEVYRSEKRIDWQADMPEYVAWGVPLPRLAEVKQWAWRSFQNRLIRNQSTVVYSTLANHPLWVPERDRTEFHPRQTDTASTPVPRGRAVPPLANGDDMKAVAAAAMLILTATTAEDLKYEIAVREAFTAFEAQVETIRQETGATSADRLVPVLMPRRSLWRNAGGTGFFERLNNDFFVEKLGTGEAKLYRVVDRNDSYIELALVEGGWMARLYEDRLTVKSPTSQEFKQRIGGKWER